MPRRRKKEPLYLHRQRRVFELTQREKLILTLVAAGFERREIAMYCGTSQSSISGGMHNVLNKLGAVNGANAVFLGLCKGIISAEATSELAKDKDRYSVPVYGAKPLPFVVRRVEELCSADIN